MEGLDGAEDGALEYRLSASPCPVLSVRKVRFSSGVSLNKEPGRSPNGFKLLLEGCEVTDANSEPWPSTLLP